MLRSWTMTLFISLIIDWSIVRPHRRDNVNVNMMNWVYLSCTWSQTRRENDTTRCNLLSDQDKIPADPLNPGSLFTRLFRDQTQRQDTKILCNKVSMKVYFGRNKHDCWANRAFLPAPHLRNKSWKVVQCFSLCSLKALRLKNSCGQR